MSVLKEVDALVKQAARFGPNGRAFIMDRGDTPTSVAKQYSKLYPNRKTSPQHILSANPGVDAKKYMPGRMYKINYDDRNIYQGEFPLIDRRKGISYGNKHNNPVNVLYYPGVGWYGGVYKGGLKPGDVLPFESPEAAARAGLMTWKTLGGRHGNTIANIAPHYNDVKDKRNNLDSYIKTLESISGIGRNDALDWNNSGQMVDLLRSLVHAESGSKAWKFFAQDLPGVTNLVNTIHYNM